MFSVKFMKFSRTSILKNNCERLLPVFHFYMPRKHQKTEGFLTFSGDAEMENATLRKAPPVRMTIHKWINIYNDIFFLLLKTRQLFTNLKILIFVLKLFLGNCKHGIFELSNLKFKLGKNLTVIISPPEKATKIYERLLLIVKRRETSWNRILQRSCLVWNEDPGISFCFFIPLY